MASALAFLERRGHASAGVDLAVVGAERIFAGIEPGRLRLVAVSVPMHTALHIAVRCTSRIREAAPQAHLCFFGHYAWLNSEFLLAGTADSVVGGECEETLAELADALRDGTSPRAIPALRTAGRAEPPVLQRLSFPAPRREGLPALERYARLQIGTERRLAAAVETSRGCLHLCRHCPIPAVYGGRFFVVPRAVVLEDLRRVVAAGARHVSFADPDFFNGPGHSLAVARALHAEFPELTFDITTKVEHLIRHRARLPELAAAGCLFVVSAVESLSDTVLDHLRKGHTRRDVFEALRVVREAGLALRPSFVPFTPWTRRADYVELLDWIEGEALVDHVDPVQLSIRLLVPPGSTLLELPAMRRHLRGLRAERFSHDWEHPDPSMDRLHAVVSSIVAGAARDGAPAAPTYERVRRAAGGGVRVRPTRFPPRRSAAAPPRLTEPWFC